MRHRPLSRFATVPMRRLGSALAAAVALASLAVPAWSAGEAAAPAKAVAFAKGTSSTGLRGALQGRDDVSCRVNARNGLLRRVLFVKGQPVASDATEAAAATREGDRITVKVGNDETFEITDAFLTGG